MPNKNSKDRILKSNEYELRFFNRKQKTPAIDYELLTFIYKLLLKKKIITTTNLNRFIFVQNEYQTTSPHTKLRYRVYLKKRKGKNFPADHQEIVYKKELKRKFFKAPLGLKDHKYKFSFNEEYFLYNQNPKKIETICYRERIQCPISFKKFVKTFAPEITLTDQNYYDPIIMLDNIKRSPFNRKVETAKQSDQVFEKIKPYYSIEFDYTISTKKRRTSFNQMLKQGKILAAILDNIIKLYREA